MLVVQYNEIHVMSGMREKELHVSSAVTCRMKWSVWRQELWDSPYTSHLISPSVCHNMISLKTRQAWGEIIFYLFIFFYLFCLSFKVRVPHQVACCCIQLSDHSWCFRAVSFSPVCRIRYEMITVQESEFLTELCPVA